MIVAMGTELAFAMCIGCHVPEEVRETTCYKNKGQDALETGNTCYLDEIKKGNLKPDARETLWKFRAFSRIERREK